MATTAQAWSGLWRLAVSHDLITKVVAENRPADDPLFDLLAARRRAVSRPTDALWVRLCDLPAALAARVYQLEGRITFGVIDPFLDRRVTVMVESDSGGSVSREVETEPDLALDLEDLSACYMGWSRFRDLAALGRITGDQATLLKADLMFGWSPGPWCPEIF
jgi:predicted acetyltransferase